MPSIQDRRDRETVVRPSYQKRRARVSSERNGETTSSRRLLPVEEQEEEEEKEEEDRLLAKLDLYRAIPSFQAIHLLPSNFCSYHESKEARKKLFLRERKRERKSERVSPKHRLIRTLALLYLTHIYTLFSSPILLDKKRGNFNWRWITASREACSFFFFFFCEDRNLDLEEGEGEKREKGGRFSRGYNNKDALGIIEEQVVE